MTDSAHIVKVGSMTATNRPPHGVTPAMKHEFPAPTLRWPSLALIAGGSLMIGLWLIFTNVHGPTSYNLDQPFLGQGMQFWGMLLGGPPNLLVAAALLGLAPRLTQSAPRRARVGLGLAVFGLGLAVANALNLIGGILNELTLTPVIGVGLLLLALGRTASPALPRAALAALVVIGVLDLVAFFAWSLMPVKVSDAVGGYRLFGLLAHVGTGLGWVALGLAWWPLPSAFSRPART